MSDIATLEKLEPHLAQVAHRETLGTASAAAAPSHVMANGRQGSHLELFFSEIRYATFVTKKKPAPTQSPSSGSQGATLKYRLRLH